MLKAEKHKGMETDFPVPKRRTFKRQLSYKIFKMVAITIVCVKYTNSKVS